MKKFLFDCGTRESTASLGILALRVMIGLMMLIGHGIPKIQDYAQRSVLFPVPNFFPLNHMSPQVSLMTCIAAEVFATIMIILGFAMRPAAFALGLCMVVVVFSYHHSAPWFFEPPTLVECKELGLLYLIPMIALILTGAGSYSLDSAIYKEGKRRRW